MGDKKETFSKEQAQNAHQKSTGNTGSLKCKIIFIF